MDNQYPELDIKKYTERVDALPGNSGDEMSEDQLIKTIEQRELSTLSYYNELKEIADSNRQYYTGNQIDKTKLYVGETPIVINRILPSIETIIPIVTERIPEADVTVTPTTKKNKTLQEKIEKKLHDLWSRDMNMQSKLEVGLRNLACNRYMALKVVYNENTKEPDVVVLPAGKILFPKTATGKDDLPFLIEYVTATVAELIEKFPDKEAEIRAEVQMTDRTSDDSTVTYIEYWEPKFVAWKFKKKILGFDPNPFWNWDDQEFNHIKYPEIPYFFVNLYNFGDSLVDPISMVELVKTPQDGINKRKRQIEQNAAMANGKMVFAGNKISKESASSVKNTPEEKVYLDKADDVNGAIAMLTGRAFDQGILTDMTHSEDEIDNILGTHSSTRGENDPAERTARGKMLLKSGDVSRQKTLVRSMERLSKAIYNYLVQCMYVYYDDPHPLHPSKELQRTLSAADSVEFIQRDEFKDNVIEVEVIDGSVMPKDKDALKAEAMQLAEGKMMSLLDMYKILEYPNPEKLARNAIMEQADPTYLYSEVSKGDQIDFQAVRNLIAIQHNSTGQPLPIVFQVEDLKLMTRYLDTLSAYLKGEEISDDLIPFTSLTEDAQAEIMDHFEHQKNLTEELANSQLTGQVQQQGGLDPALIDMIASAVLDRLKGGGGGNPPPGAPPEGAPPADPGAMPSEGAGA